MKRTKRKEYWGDFWLQSEPDRRVPGHLTFHPSRGGELVLHAPMHADSRTMDRDRFDRILGVVLGRSCVLLDCFVSGRSTSETGPGEWETQVRIFVNAMLLGPRRNADSPAQKFVTATASFHGLPEFDGRMPFKHVTGSDSHRVDDDKGNDPNGPMRQLLSIVGLEGRTVETNRAKIEFLQGTGSRSHDLKSETLVSSHWMRVTPHTTLSLDELIDLFNQVRTLIAIALHQDCRFHGPMSLLPEPRIDDSSADDSYQQSYDYHARWSKGTSHTSELYNRVLSYESLGPDGIARWLSLEDDCGHVISRLSSLRYATHLPFEDALLRVVAAADSLHRVVYPRKNYTKARTMLQELAEYAGYPVRNAIPNLDNWAHAVITERDNAAHNKGLIVSKPDLTTELVQSVYFLVLVALLRRAGAPTGAFEGVRHSQPFVWPTKRIFGEFGGDS